MRRALSCDSGRSSMYVLRRVGGHETRGDALWWNGGVVAWSEW